MTPHRLFLVVAPLSLLAACANPGPSASDDYWRSTARQRSDFATDNQSCAAAATRKVPTARADQPPGGVAIPNNRIDQPPRHWANAVAEDAYMDCMRSNGWALVQR